MTSYAFANQLACRLSGPAGAQCALGAVDGDDELIAGARLQWSVMLGVPYVFSQLGSKTFQQLTGKLRQALTKSGLRQVQVTTSSFDDFSYTGFKEYPGRFVVEMTTQMNRRQKADLHYDLQQMAAKVGLAVDPNPAHDNLALMQQGGKVTAGAPGGGIPNEPYQRPDASKQNNGTSALDSFAAMLGLSTPVAIAAIVLGGLVILKR